MNLTHLILLDFWVGAGTGVAAAPLTVYTSVVSLLKQPETEISILKTPVSEVSALKSETREVSW